MSEKLFNFLSSFGIMLIGVVLLFVGSVSFEIKKNPQFLAFPQSQARALSVGGDIEAANLPKAKPTIPLPINNSTYASTITAAVVLILDDKTDTILFEKNSDQVRALASVSKLMSALVLSDLPMHWSSTTEIIVDDIDSSSHHINAGEKYQLSDLWNIALVGSSNSAVNALVRASGLSKEEFVAKMNEKSQRLGLRSMKFADPTGLDNRNMAKAEDIAKLLKLALEKENILKSLQIAEYYAKPIGKSMRRVWSTNWLLNHWVPSEYKAAQIAGKTGYISDSDYNFAVRLIDKNNRAIRTIILGSESNESRFTEARDISNWIFSHYLWPHEEGYEKLAS